jgi:hypothetical protein
MIPPHPQLPLFKLLLYNSSIILIFFLFSPQIDRRTQSSTIQHWCCRSTTPASPKFAFSVLQRSTDAKLHNPTLVFPLYNSSITITFFFFSPRKAPQSNTRVACNLQILAGVCLQSTNPKRVPGLANSLKLFGRSIEGQKSVHTTTTHLYMCEN